MGNHMSSINRLMGRITDTRTLDHDIEALMLAGEAPEAPAAPRAPLEVLQGILLDVGARLALNQAVSSARAAAAQGSGRWAGLIRLDRATVRPVGVRCA